MPRVRHPAGAFLRAIAVDLGPLRRHRDFRRLFVGQMISGTGRQVTVVAIPFQIYALTGSTLAVGMLGLVQVVPLVAASLIGGAVADRVDRRRLLLLTNLLLGGCSSGLAAAALTGHASVWLLFGTAALIAAVGAVDQPTRTAVVPSLVSPADLPAALALSYGFYMVAWIAGPALGGVVIARGGLGAAYSVDAGTFVAAVVAVALLPPLPPRGAVAEPALRAIRTGLAYVRSRRDLVGSFAADMNAMVFGMPRALFPVLAATVYHTGPDGLGLLYAAPGAGALLAIGVSSGLARSVRLGRVVVLCTMVWGAAIAIAGAMPVLAPALICLAVAGAADAGSAVCRNQLTQATTPDHLRGRVSATHAMVVVSGPYLGDVEGGTVGALVGPVASVVSGGLLCVAGAVVVGFAFPELWDLRMGGTPTSPPGPRPGADDVPGVADL